MQHHISHIKNDSKSWTVFFVLGIIFIITGCYSLFHPFAKDVSISRLFGILALLTGIVKVVFSKKHKQTLPHWKTHLAIGIFDALIGIFLLTFHGISTLILPFILSFWILSEGIAVGEEAADIKIFHTSGVDWMIVGASLTLVSFFMVGYLPLLGSLATMLSTATFLITIGLFYLFLSLRLISIRKEFHDEKISLLNRQQKNAA